MRLPVSTVWLESRLKKTSQATPNTSFERYYNDPVGFAHDVIGLETWDRQEEVLRAAATHTRVLVRSGHKVSKSTSGGACLPLWWIATRPQGRVILLANTATQVKEILWRELMLRFRQLRQPIGEPITSDPLDPTTGLRFRDGRQIIGLSTKTKEHLAGISGAELLFVIDESSGFPDDLYETVEGNAAGGATIVGFSNPTKTSGWFYNGFRKHRDRYALIHISSEDSPNVRAGKVVIPGLATADYVELQRKRFGPDYNSHPVYQVRVKGEFPEHASNSVIGMATVESAVARWQDTAPDGLGSQLRIGVDVARFGDDETVIWPVRGDYAYRPTVVTKADGPTVAAICKRLASGLHRPGDERPVFNVDGIGVGASVVDSLRQLGCQVAEINVGTASTTGDHANLRSQLWFALGDWLKTGALPPDDETETEILAPIYELDIRNRLRVQSKDDMRKKLGRSPDRADALALAVYVTRPSSAVVETGGRRESAGQDLYAGGGSIKRQQRGHY